MKILFISAVLPYPLYSGGQVRIYNLLKQLSEKHEITLCSFIRNEDERTYGDKLPFLSSVHMVYRGHAMEPRYLMKVFGNYPLLLETYNNEDMRRLIAEELKNNHYDLVHIEPFYVYPSVPQSSIPLVVSEHNIEYSVYEANAKVFSLVPLRPILAADAKKVRVWEERIWKKATAVIAVSGGDAQQIHTASGRTVSVVPNGVDTQLFSYAEHLFNVTSPTFLFVGNFSWAPNREAVSMLLKHIWPAISHKFPQAKLSIVGKQFPQSLRSCIKNNVVLFPDVVNIHDSFCTHDVLLAPMGIGGGTKFKILEAMASGTAIITTKAGYMGIQAVAGQHLLEANETKDFVQAVELLYTRPKNTMAMTRLARLLVEKKYDWRSIAIALDRVWRSLQ
jgi:polysaccharide biosynthesis protein PslH